MPNFTDSRGRVWPIEINFRTAKRVLNDCTFDLFDLERIDTILRRLRFDTLLVGDIVMSLLTSELTARSVDPKQLEESLDGAAIESASDAILEGLESFFRRGPKGQLLSQLIQAIKENERMALAEALTKLPSLTSGASDTNSAVSSA